MKKIFFTFVVALFGASLSFSQSVTLAPGITTTDEVAAKKVYTLLKPGGISVGNERILYDKLLRVGINTTTELGKEIVHFKKEDMKSLFPNDVMSHENGEEFSSFGEMQTAMLAAMKVLKEELVNMQAIIEAQASRIAILEGAPQGVTVRVAAGPNDPAPKILLANKADTSVAMLVHSYTIRVTGGGFKIDSIPVKLNLAKTLGETQTGASVPDYGPIYKAVIGKVWIEVNGESFNPTMVRSTGTSLETEVNTINFSVNRSFGTPTETTGAITVTVNVYVKLAPLPDNGASSNGVRVSSSVIGTSLVLKTINGITIPPSKVTGSATGYTHTIRVPGITVTMGVPEYSHDKDSVDAVTSIKYTIPVVIQAYGGTYYMGQTAQYADAVSGSNSFAVVLQTSAAPTTSATIPGGYAPIVTLSSGAPVSGSGFRFDDGTTRTVYIKITLNGDKSAPTTSYRAALKQLRFFGDANLSMDPATVNLTPIENFRTDYQLIE